MCGKNATYEPDEVTGEKEWTGTEPCKAVRKDAAKCGPDAVWYEPYGAPRPAPAEWPMECGVCPVKQMFDQENQTEGESTT